MATLKFVIKKSHKSKISGKSTIYLRLSHNYKQKYIPTDLKVEPEFFDNSAGKVADEHPNSLSYNLKIIELESGYTHTLIEFSSVIKSLDIDEVAKILKDRGDASLTYYLKRRIETSRDTATVKATERWITTRNHVIEFGGKSVMFSDVDTVWLSRFSKYLSVDKKNSSNSVGIHLRNIRTMFNEAISDRVIDLNKYPFRKGGFRIPKHDPSRFWGLEVRQLTMLRDLSLTGKDAMARDMFMLTFYLIGINFVDLFQAKKESVKYDHLWYTRSKTRKEYCIKLQPEAVEIINRYSGREHLISFAESYTNHRDALKIINRHLNEIVKNKDYKDLNLKELTTYYARHTWATMAKIKLRKSEPDVAMCLGHGANTITGIYTKAILIERWEYPNEINRELLDMIK